MRLLEPLAPKWLKLFPLVNFKRCKTISNSWLNEFFFTSQVHKWGFWCLLCKVEAPVGSIILLKHDQTKHSQQHVVIVSIFKSSKNRVSNLPTKKQRVQNFDSSNNSKIFFFIFLTVEGLDDFGFDFHCDPQSPWLNPQRWCCPCCPWFSVLWSFWWLRSKVLAPRFDS